ncbi:hypothetical protein B0H16DRAFT_1524293 [Mycena metata]|uniref:Uncharacterized protein n=1 Tax=Mycena metata TaxID=1033252 RepID=A0AAD7NKM9_9AGAR|nr:hypothetical protein B0H16DRAFT_1524293 [Mycena metata]
MSILNSITDAACRAWNPEKPASLDDIHCRLEWTWGLEYGALNEHLQSFNSDRQLADILANKDLMVLTDWETIGKMSLHLSHSPKTISGSRIMIQDVYDRCSFEYLVLPVDPSSGIAPQLLISSVPPHVTVAPSVDHLLKRWGYEQDLFDAACKSIMQHVAANPPAGATFQPNFHTFTDLRYLHERWATRSVPSQFRGLEGSDDDVEEAVLMNSDEGSSTLEWEVATLPSEEEEPRRRLLPHELAADLVVKFRTLVRVADDGDEVISCDSYITGHEGRPEEFSKASMARATSDEKDAAWEQGIKSWVQGTSVVDDERMLLNDDQIEEDPKEQPRVAATLDLEKPDYLARQEKVR